VADEEGRVRDGILFYVNHAFERQQNMEASQVLGRRVSALFRSPDEKWRDVARRAALEGESILERASVPDTGAQVLVTASPVIHPGYCCFTVQQIDGA
jgi:hypothetical protein